MSIGVNHFQRGGDGGCYDLHTTDSKKDMPLTISTAVYLKDDYEYIFQEGLEHTPRVGEVLVINRKKWRVVEWTNRIECERVAN